MSVEKPLGNCALCAEAFTSPGDRYALALVAAPPDAGKARPIFRTLPVCTKCALPSSDGQLIMTVRRLAGIWEKRG
jgi:hypothetical protein